MSKKLIAGLGTVAALGIAALPLVGVSAVDDTTIVRVRVPESVQCQSSGTDTDFVWLGEVPYNTDASRAFTVTGSTNAAAGFDITGTAHDMVSGTLATATGADDVKTNAFTADETGASTIAYSRNAAASGNNGSWWLTSTDTNVAISTEANTIALTGTRAAGEQTFSLTANVRPGYNNKPGIYQGDIEWTCSVHQ